MDLNINLDPFDNQSTCNKELFLIFLVCPFGILSLEKILLIVLVHVFRHPFGILSFKEICSRRCVGENIRCSASGVFKGAWSRFIVI